MENVDKSSRSIFVGNIPYEATEEDLKAEFSKAGPVVGFRLVRDKDTNNSKGFGFCEFSSNEIAASAIRNLTNMQFRGRALRIGSAIGEQNSVDISISNSFSLVKHPIETPYGESVDPHEVIPNINSAVSSIPPEQLYDLMTQMKVFIQSNPDDARQLLIENPQLTYALLQAQMSMRVIEPNVAIGMMMQSNDQTIDNNLSSRNKNKNLIQHPFLLNGNNDRQELIQNVNPHGNQGQMQQNIHPNLNQINLGQIQHTMQNDFTIENNVQPGNMPHIIQNIPFNGYHVPQGQMLQDIHGNQMPPHMQDIHQNRGNIDDIHQSREQLQDMHHGRGPMQDIHQGRGPMSDIHQGRSFFQGREQIQDIHQSGGPIQDVHRGRSHLSDIHQGRDQIHSVESNYHPGEMPSIHSSGNSILRGQMPDMHQNENQFIRGQIPQPIRNVLPQHYNGPPPTFQQPFEFQR